MKGHVRAWAKEMVPLAALGAAIFVAALLLGSSRWLDGVLNGQLGLQPRQAGGIRGAAFMLVMLPVLVLIVRANNRLNHLHRRVHDSEGRVCPRCHYDLPPEADDPAANAPITCPECGHVTSEFALRREWRFYLTRQPRRR